MTARSQNFSQRPRQRLIIVPPLLNIILMPTALRKIYNRYSTGQQAAIKMVFIPAYDCGGDVYEDESVAGRNHDDGDWNRSDSSGAAIVHHSEF